MRVKLYRVARPLHETIFNSDLSFKSANFITQKIERSQSFVEVHLHCQRPSTWSRLARLTGLARSL